MRLIDADELKIMLCRETICSDYDEAVAYNQGIGHSMVIVDKMPTVGDGLVKHGKWLNNAMGYKCSNCGGVWRYYDMNYCPDCGAKMEFDR